jgi:hypothetical protein
MSIPASVSDSPNTCPGCRAPLVRINQRCVECQTLCVMSVGEPFEDNLPGFFWNPKAGVWIDLLALRRRGEMEH